MRYLWMQAGLAISLAFNIGLVIFVLNRPPAWHPHTPDDFLARVAGKMPAGDFQKLTAVMDKARPEIAQRRAASDAAMQQVEEVLKAEPFDEVGLRAAMKTIRQSHCQTEEAFQAVILEAAPDLTPEGRATLVPSSHPVPKPDLH